MRLRHIAFTAAALAGLAAGCTDADGDGIEDRYECGPGDVDGDGDGRCNESGSCAAVGLASCITVNRPALDERIQNAYDAGDYT